MEHAPGGMAVARGVLVAGILPCLLVAGLLGCSRRPPVPDGGLLAEGSCTPPCWNGIRPGESTAEGAETALRQSGLVEPGSITVDRTGGKATQPWRITWRDLDGRTSRACLGDGRVLRLDIAVDWDATATALHVVHIRYGPEGDIEGVRIGLRRYLSLGDVVRVLGPPECVRATAMGVELPGLLVELEYPSRGVSVLSWTCPVRPREVSPAATVTPGMRVSGVHYYEPGPYKAVLQRAYLLTPVQAATCSGQCVAWRGFGRIKVETDGW